MSATTSLFDVTGRVAVVTGGNGGIGRAIAFGLARGGASVAVLACNEQKNQAVLAELRTMGVPSLALQLDITDRAALVTAMAQVEMQLGPIDILVNNAGIAKASGGVLAETAEAWDAALETHLNSCFLPSQLAARSMVGRKSGKIINLASMYSFFGAARLPSYSAAKGAVVQLTKSMAIELAPHNIQVNAIAPGWIETDMTAPARTSPMNEAILARTPLQLRHQTGPFTTELLAQRAADTQTEFGFGSARTRASLSRASGCGALNTARNCASASAARSAGWVQPSTTMPIAPAPGRARRPSRRARAACASSSSRRTRNGWLRRMRCGCFDRTGCDAGRRPRIPRRTE
jgi:2-deoxy-D-gluconate 3-dehydrogenase